MSKYIPGHVIEEARDLRRQGHSLESLANRLGIEPEALGMLLGEPAKRELKAAADAAEFDLFRTEELDGVL